MLITHGRGGNSSLEVVRVAPIASVAEAAERVREKLDASTEAMRWRKLQGVLEPPRFDHAVAGPHTSPLC